MNPARLCVLLFVATFLFGFTAAAQQPERERGIRLFEQQAYAEARAVLEPYARAHPKDAVAAAYIGRAYLEEGKADKAVEWLERAVRLEAGNAGYQAQLGNAYGRKALGANLIQQASLAKKAKGAYDAAVAIDPANLEARWGLLQFYLLAPGVMGGDKNKARAQAAEIRKRNAYQGVLAEASVQRAEKDLAALRKTYEAGLRAYPDSLDLHFGLVFALEQAQAYEAAFDHLEALARRRPNEMGLVYQVGRLGAVTGRRLPQAEAALLRYLKHTPAKGQPPLAAAQWRLGMVYEQQGRKDQARAAYQAALALDPRHKGAREALKRF